MKPERRPERAAVSHRSNERAELGKNRSPLPAAKTTVPVFKSPFDYMVVLPSQRVIEGLLPDFKTLSQISARGVIATAPGDEADFVSRCFFPQSGIDEDPVTGSSHCCLTPYWSQKLGKTEMNAYQASPRGGAIRVRLDGDRVKLAGHAVTVLRGELLV